MYTLICYESKKERRLREGFISSLHPCEMTVIDMKYLMYNYHVIKFHYRQHPLTQLESWSCLTNTTWLKAEALCKRKLKRVKKDCVKVMSCFSTACCKVTPHASINVMHNMSIISPNLQMLFWTGVNNWWFMWCFSSILQFRDFRSLLTHFFCFKSPCHFTKMSPDLSPVNSGALGNICSVGYYNVAKLIISRKLSRMYRKLSLHQCWNYNRTRCT